MPETKRVTPPTVYKSYRFDIGGNGSTIGLCARVVATSEEEAVERLRKAFDKLQEGGDVSLYDDVSDSDDDRPEPGVEYVKVYLYPDDLKVSQIDEIDEYSDLPAGVGLKPKMVVPGEGDDAACESCLGYGYFDDAAHSWTLAARFDRSRHLGRTGPTHRDDSALLRRI